MHHVLQLLKFFNTLYLLKNFCGRGSVIDTLAADKSYCIVSFQTPCVYIICIVWLALGMNLKKIKRVMSPSNVYKLKCFQCFHDYNGSVIFPSRIWHISEQLVRPYISKWMPDTGKWCWWCQICSSWWAGRCKFWQVQNCRFLHLSNHYQSDISHIHHSGTE